MSDLEPCLPSTRARGLPAKLKSAWASAWRPVPLPVPRVDPELPRLGFVVRSAEVIRYQVLRVEHALSPGGGLRAWVRINLLVGLALLAPALLVVPFATALLAGFAGWTTFIALAAANLLQALISLVCIALIIGTIVYLLGQWLAARRGGHGAYRL